jgi:CcmD family protein
MLAIHFLLSADPTPDTSVYFIAGYVVIFIVMVAYLASLIVRQRNLEQDYEALEELERSGSSNDGKVPVNQVGTSTLEK